VRNCLAGNILPIEPAGRNYRLPSNGTVLRFAARLLGAKARRLAYGAFVEKAWEVASAEVAAGSPEELVDAIARSSPRRTVRRPDSYLFLADPFPHPHGGVLVEALRASDGQGEIVHFGDGPPRVLCSGPGHFSYPATVKSDGQWFLLPEVSEWTVPRLYRLTPGGCEDVGELEVEGAPRLIDATLHAGTDGLYLFANAVADGSQVLRLWTADSLVSRFTEHPESPVRISPAGGRMAGALLALGGRLYRLGQDCSRGYGRRILLFELLALSRTHYEERSAGEISLEGAIGPHTLNLAGESAWFDFYRERLSPLAGIRRIRAGLAKRRALGSAAVHLPR
jgi:hypothetical protein